jgi:hypothetical protein
MVAQLKKVTQGSNYPSQLKLFRTRATTPYNTSIRRRQEYVKRAKRRAKQELECDKLQRAFL